MEATLEALGIHWTKMLAQVLLFLAVFWVLKTKAFGPITAMLEERRSRIAEGEKNLEKIRNDLEAADAKAREIIDKANHKADHMIAEAQASADALGEKKRQEAVAEANQIMAKANEAARLEQERARAELRRDFGRLVVDTTSKVTGKVLTAEDQARINRETAGQIAL